MQISTLHGNSRPTTLSGNAHGSEVGLSPGKTAVINLFSQQEIYEGRFLPGLAHDGALRENLETGKRPTKTTDKTLVLQYDGCSTSIKLRHRLE